LLWNFRGILTHRFSWLTCSAEDKGKRTVTPGVTRNVRLLTALLSRHPHTGGKLIYVNSMSMDQIARSKKQQQAISRAFEGACEELGIGLLSLDAWKRERLAQLILSFVDKGEFDAAALQKHAVAQYKNVGAESSSTA
jgi:hypothetical protein